MRNELIIIISIVNEPFFQSFRSSLSLLEEANSHAAKLPGRETARLCKLLIWMLLMTKIQHCIHELPCVDSEYKCIPSWL